jgi:hypothetical protein
VGFAAITFCVASQRVSVVVVVVVYFVIDSVRKFWIHPRTCRNAVCDFHTRNTPYGTNT